MKLGSNCARCTREHTQVTCVEIRLIPKRVATMSCALLSLMRGREAENKGECEEDWIKECSSPWAAYKNTHSGILFRLVIHSWLFNLGFSFGPCLSSWTWFTLYTLVFSIPLFLSLPPFILSAFPHVRTVSFALVHSECYECLCPKISCQWRSPWGKEVLHSRGCDVVQSKHAFNSQAHIFFYILLCLTESFIYDTIWTPLPSLHIRVPIVWYWWFYTHTFFLFCLYFRYPSQHVFCSEQSLSGPGQSAGDKNPDGHKPDLEQDTTQFKVCWGFVHLHVPQSVSQTKRWTAATVLL